MKFYQVRVEVLYADTIEVAANNESDAESRAMEELDEAFEAIQDVTITEITKEDK